jgi:hypothetical protein
MDARDEPPALGAARRNVGLEFIERYIDRWPAASTESLFRFPRLKFIASGGALWALLSLSTKAFAQGHVIH